MRGVPDEEHVRVGRVAHADEARLVLQRGHHTQAGPRPLSLLLLLLLAVGVGPAGATGLHGLACGQAGVLQQSGDGWSGGSVSGPLKRPSCK